jgi:hypothetical protein
MGVKGSKLELGSKWEKTEKMQVNYVVQRVNGSKRE